MTTRYEMSRSKYDGSFRVFRLEGDRREPICKCDQGSMEENAENAALIVKALNEGVSNER